MEHVARRSTLQQRPSMREVSRKLYSISKSVSQEQPVFRNTHFQTVDYIKPLDKCRAVGNWHEYLVITAIDN